jgi:hypothetical protein
MGTRHAPGKATLEAGSRAVPARRAGSRSSPFRTIVKNDNARHGARRAARAISVIGSLDSTAMFTVLADTAGHAQPD